MKVIFILILWGLTLPAWAKRKEKGLYFRILKISAAQKVMLMNRGEEENLKPGDHAYFYDKKKLIAKAELKNIAPTRSIWQIFEIHEREKLKQDEVLYFVLKDPVEVTPSPKEEAAPLLTLEKQLPVEQRIHSAFYRYNLFVGSGTRTGQNYYFPGGLAGRTHGQIYHLKTSWMQFFDEGQPLLWGPVLHLSSLSQKLLTQNQVSIQEKRLILGIGPQIKWDLYQSMVQRITTSFALIYNPIHQVEFAQTRATTSDYQRATFRGQSISTMIAAEYHRLDILEKLNLLFSLGLQVTLSHTLTTSDDVSDSSYWSAPQISNPRSADAQILLGLQYPY